MTARANTFWLTGLSGAGKSTLAIAVQGIISSAYCKNLYLLDGDVLRGSELCKSLGFSREDRKENLRRAASVAAILNDAGVTVIASFISPYEEDRAMVKSIIGEGFREIWIHTPLEVCESRDVKGLYKKARSGSIPNFTGLTDPYEIPTAPDFVVQTAGFTPSESACSLAAYIESVCRTT